MISSPPAPALANRRQFTCVAQLISLLSHSEVAGHPLRSDSALDMISALREGAPALRVLRAFCRVRQCCEPVCYLILFRLRRWLEDEIVVTAAGGEAQPLDLSFQSMERTVQNYRRNHWEWSETTESLRGIRIDFDWKSAPGPTRTSATATLWRESR